MTRHRARLLSDEDFAVFRTELRQFRDAANLSQKAAAVLIGSHEATWARWERGERRPPAHVVEGVRALLASLLEREKGRVAVAAHRERKKAANGAGASGASPAR